MTTTRAPSLRPMAALESFGPYVLLYNLGNGGMATISVARPASAGANGRLVVIKRLLPRLSQDPEFHRMFEAEIQVCMSFSHPNIVQIYDFGTAQGPHGEQPYIAMEYVAGRNLRQILNQFAKLGQPLPLSFVLSVCAGAAAGLHYAHQATDPLSGEPLGIVHRDISPQNILVTFDGNAKLIDFGIAKGAANTETDTTRTGTIKGKLSYLAPEQTLGQPADARSDLFALGVVLWEMLAGHKLFAQTAGLTELDVLNRIRSCSHHITPPSQHNPQVGPELDAIVLKCLAENPDNRLGSAEELQLALRSCLVREYPQFGYRDVGGILRVAFESDREHERNTLKRLNDEAQARLERGELAEITLSGGSKLIAKPTESRLPPVDFTPLPNRLTSRARPELGAEDLSLDAFTPLPKSWLARSWRLLVAAGAIAALAYNYVHQTESRIRLASLSGPVRGGALERRPAQIDATASDIILRVRAFPAHDVSGIYINDIRLHDRSPAARIPLDQRLELRVERKSGGAPVTRAMVFPSRAFQGVKSHTLDVDLR